MSQDTRLQDAFWFFHDSVVQFCQAIWRHKLDCVMLQGQAYSDAGATAYDAIDGAITNITTAGVNEINTLVVSCWHVARPTMHPEMTCNARLHDMHAASVPDRRACALCMS